MFPKHKSALKLQFPLALLDSPVRRWLVYSVSRAWEAFGHDVKATSAAPANTHITWGVEQDSTLQLLDVLACYRLTAGNEVTGVVWASRWNGNIRKLCTSMQACGRVEGLVNVWRDSSNCGCTSKICRQNRATYLHWSFAFGWKYLYIRNYISSYKRSTRDS